MNYARMNPLYTGSLRTKKNHISILRNLTFYKWCGTKVAHCIYIDTYLYLAPTVFICRAADPPIILNMHECIFRMRVGSAGRQIDRAGTKYSSRYVYVPTCRPTSHPVYTYMAYHILCIFIDVDLYLALGLSMCRPADLPTNLSS